MPTIALSKSSVRRPRQIDGVIVESIMLYPSDKDFDDRHRFLQTRRALIAVQEIMSGRTNLETMSERKLEATLRLLLDATPPKQAEQDASVRLFEGAAIGKMCYRLLRPKNSGLHNLSTAKEEAIETLAAMQRGRVTMDTIGRKWSLYRPAAHLWAAFYALTTLYAGAKPSVVMPSDLTRLNEFLDLAEHILDLGSSTPTEGRRHRSATTERPTLLDRGTAWTVAPEIACNLKPGWRLS